MKGFYITIDGKPQCISINPAYHGPCDLGCGGPFGFWDAFDLDEVSFFNTLEEAEKYCVGGAEVKEITI